MNDWLQNSNKTWICGIGSFHDPFDPSLICDTLADPDHGLRGVVFGWDTICKDTPCDDEISRLFIEVDGEFYKLFDT